MKYWHIVPGANDVANGMARVARLLAKEQGAAEVVDLTAVSSQRLAVSGGDGKVEPCRGVEGEFGIGSQWLGDSCEEVWVHGMWLPREWAVCWRVLSAGKRLVRMTHGSLSPVYLKQQGRWKKWLVGPIERWLLRRCAKIVATCEAEKEWIEAYLGKRCPEIVVEDVKRFFKLGVRGQRLVVSGEGLAVSGQRLAVRGQELGVGGDGCNSKQETGNKKLYVLYLGRRHPLKGIEFLEKAVKELGVRGQELGDSEENSKLETRNLELKIVSNAFGEELEKVWEWCDVLVLPTLSENFGLVVAEALERGKRVITTDGAPVWGGDLNRVERVDRVEGELGIGFDGRLIYLKGYRDGSDEERVELLKRGILVVSGDGILTV